MRLRACARTLAAVLWCMAPGFALGEAPAAPRSLSEDEFVSEFLKSNPRLDVAAARVEQARAGVATARHRANPTLVVDREEVFAEEGALPEHFVRLGWPLDLWGRRGRRVAAAEKGVEVAGADAEAEQSTLLFDALELYQEAAYRRLRVELLEGRRGSLASAVDTLRTRAGAGDAAAYDADRLELELLAYDDAIVSARGDLAAVRQAMAVLLGDAAGAVDAATALALPTAPDGVETSVASGLEARDDRRAAKLRARQGELAEAAGDAARWPSPSLSLGMKTVEVGDETAVGYLVGVSLDLPFFDAGRGDRASGRAMRAEAGAELRALDLEVAGAIRAAHEQLAARVEQARAFAAGPLARVDELARRAQVAYREGDRPLAELLDAVRLVRDVRQRDLELRRDARLALVALWRAKGGRS
jgi:outer membrane protein TolC